MLVVGFGAVLLFATYCQVHSWFDAATVPASVSLQWGLAMGLPCAVGAHLLWRQSTTLSDLAGRGPLTTAGLWLGLTALGVAIGGVIHVAIGGVEWQDFTLRLLERMYDLLPEVAALAALVICLLLLRRRLAPVPQDADGGWISFPEAPALHLRLADITYVRSAGNYCEIHANGRNHLVRMTMQRAAQYLEPLGFARIHRTLIVRLSRIVDIDRCPRARSNRAHRQWRPVAAWQRLSCGTYQSVAEDLSGSSRMTRRTVRWFVGIVALYAALLPNMPAWATTATSSAPVSCISSSTEGLEELWSRYLQGLRTGNLNQLQSVFAAEGSFHSLSKSKDGIETLAVRSFAEALPAWVASPDPQADGGVSGMTVGRNMAVLEGWLTFGSARFDDILTLYCTGGRWLIVGKLTHAQPR